MPLRPYQIDTNNAITAAYLNGIRQQLVSAATGTGKTRTFSALPNHLRHILPGRMLVLAHREELIDQALEDLHEANPSLHITKEMGGYIGDVNADIVVASIATLGRADSDRAKRFPWHTFDKIVTDEAHHAINESYTNIYRYADVLRPDTHKLHVGFTATVQRADGKAMAEVFKKIVYEYSLRRAIEEGYLVEPRGIRVRTNTSLAGVKSSNGDYSTTQLADAINNPERNQLVVKAWLDHGNGQQTIGFTADIKHAVDLAAMFVYYGVKAEAVWGDDPERKDKIARHKAGTTTVLLNCGVLTEGYNDPRIGCVLLARPTKSGVLYCQMVGRGTRLYPGKGYCIVIDVVDSTSNNSLLTLPTLMGLSTTLDLRGRGLWDSVKKLEDAAKEYPQIDFSKLADIDSLGTYIESVNLFEVKFPEEVEINSDLTWYTNPTGGYILKLPKPKDQVMSERYVKLANRRPQDQITIIQNLLDTYEIRGSIKGRRYKAERLTVEEAFKAADGLIDAQAPEATLLLQREAHWHDVPATEPQLKLLRRLYKGRAIPFDLDKGETSRLISQAMVNK